MEVFGSRHPNFGIKKLFDTNIKIALNPRLYFDSKEKSMQLK